MAQEESTRSSNTRRCADAQRVVIVRLSLSFSQQLCQLGFSPLLPRTLTIWADGERLRNLSPKLAPYGAVCKRCDFYAPISAQAKRYGWGALWLPMAILPQCSHWWHLGLSLAYFARFASAVCWVSANS